MFLFVLFLSSNSQRDSFCTNFSCCLSLLSHFVALRKLKLNITVWIQFFKRINLIPRNRSFLLKTAIRNSLVISVSTIAKKYSSLLVDKILYDADCADMSPYGDILNSLGPIRISFSRWVYLSIDKHNNPRTRE